jgi:hypothetical protein
MKRVVIRFRDGSVHSFDYHEEKVREDLRRHLGFFPGKKVAQIELQVYDPTLPRRFRYERLDLETEVSE